MPTYLSPGIYTRETDFSFYVKQISTSSAAMVGVAEKGPINKPVLETSWEQFINRFGSYINESYLAYAARAFFDNGGSVLYVTRIAHLTDSTDRDTLTALKSSIVLQNREATPADALRIEAVNEGVWGTGSPSPSRTAPSTRPTISTWWSGTKAMWSRCSRI